MKCYAQATSAGEVDLVMPTGRVTLTAEDGHRLLFHGATIVVGEFTLTRFKQLILVAVSNSVHPAVSLRITTAQVLMIGAPPRPAVVYGIQEKDFPLHPQLLWHQQNQKKRLLSA